MTKTCFDRQAPPPHESFGAGTPSALKTGNVWRPSVCGLATTACNFGFTLKRTIEETMWSKLEETLRCSVCQDIFQQPVFLTCRHSFCNSCLQEWWSQNRRPECPLCRTISPEWDPPLNMPLKSVCEAFLKQKAECQSLRSPDWQEPINPGARPGPVPRFHHVAPHKHFKYELELFGAFKGKYPKEHGSIGNG